MTSPEDTLAVLTAQLERAGLSLSGPELAALAEADRKQREGLAALRAGLDPTDEPSITFDARR